MRGEVLDVRLPAGPVRGQLVEGKPAFLEHQAGPVAVGDELYLKPPSADGTAAATPTWPQTGNPRTR